MKKLILLIVGLAALSFASVDEDVLRLVGEGNRLHDSGHYDEAIAKYKEALKLDPDNAVILYELSYSSNAKKDFKNAKEYGKKALKVNKDVRLYASICSMLGTIYDDAHQPDSALIVYRYGAKMDSTHYLLPYNVGVTFYGMGQPDSARTWFIKSSLLNKTHERSHSLLEAISRDQGRWIDFYAYGMYHLLISQKQDIKKVSLNNLYKVTKSLAKRIGTKEYDVSSPTGPKTSDVDGALVLTLGIKMASDSVGKHRLYEPDSNAEQQAEFLIRMSKDAIQLMVDFDSTAYNSPILPFYKGLEKEHLVDTFVHWIYADVDRSVYAKWRLKNDKEPDRLIKWVNGSYLGLEPSKK